MRHGVAPDLFRRRRQPNGVGHPKMNYPTRRFVSAALVLVSLLAMPDPAQAKMSQWKDLQGTSFKGEPTDILGPYVVFRTPGENGRRFLLRGFSAEDCVRIHTEIAALPARADSFAQAKGNATGSLVGNVQQVRQKELEPADLTRQPEPELLLALCGSHNSGEGWFMVSNMHAFYRRVQRIYPNLLEAVFLGTRHDAGQHRNIAVTAGMPWLVADFNRQKLMPVLTPYLPKEGATVVLLTRQGVPLVAAKAGDTESIRGFFDQVTALLWQIDPADPLGWPDRLHYLKATRPVAFAASHADPVLVGDPLRPEILGKYGVKRVAARLAVAADGKVTATVSSGPGDVPADLVAPLTTALSQALVAPAIDQGRAVAGSLDYHLEVPAPDAERDADRTWLRSATYAMLPIEDWLVLRPIKVSEKDFESSIVGETASGAIMLNAIEVNTGKISRLAQMSAFNTDFFAVTGADSVRPKPGDRQRIDENTELTWEKIQSKDGFVDMQSGVPKDYTVGYAWTEFDSPRDTEAWMGLGSDDGVKIWLNGELIHDKWIRRPSRVDEDVVPMHLKKGKNRMLIKIQNATIDWSFVYRVRLKP